MEGSSPSQPPRAIANTIPRKPLPLQRSVYVAVSQNEESPPRKPEETRSKPKNKNWKPDKKNWKLDKKKWTRRFNDCVPKHAWAREIASLVLALAMLIAIVVLLTSRQDKPLPTWPSLLAINSLVAIFSAVFKVALLSPIVEGISELKWIWFATAKSVNDFARFDSASRGPWGAAKLLVARPSNLSVSLGAIMMILALGIDPFTQQMIRFYNCQIAIDGSTATIARANSYTKVIGGGMASYSVPKLAGAVYQGLLNPPANATVDISTYCPSGNCTFVHSDGVAYSSLEICSIVTDVSQYVKGSAGGLGGNLTWNYRLPSGLNISYEPLLDNEVALASWWPPGNSTLDSAADSEATSALVALEVLMMTTDCSNPSTAAGSKRCSIKPLAVSIVVAPCVVEYGNVSISNSIFQQTAKSSTFLPAPAGLDYVSIGTSSSFPDTDCSGSKTRHGNKTTKTIMYTDDSSTWRCPVPAICSDTGNDTLWYDPACIFHFGFDAVSGLTHLLIQVFNPSKEDAGGPYNLLLSSWPITWQDDLQQWLAPLWASGHANISSVSKTIESLTGTLNAVIRAESDPTLPARGVVLGNQTCVGVEWAWFALPCGLLMLTLIFLIIISRWKTTGAIEAGRKPWKSSTLPLLWCGLQDATKGRFGPLDDVDMMEECGEGIEVALGREEGGRWKLG